MGDSKVLICWIQNQQPLKIVEKRADAHCHQITASTILVHVMLKNDIVFLSIITVVTTFYVIIDHSTYYGLQIT